MNINISHAGGLVKELEERVKGNVTISEPTIEKLAGGVVQKTLTDIFADGEKLGTVHVTTYSFLGHPRVMNVGYTGRMPGYINKSTGNDEIGLTATESRDLGPDRQDSRALMRTNDTKDAPLYRHDGHLELRLADHEIDGAMRVALRRSLVDYYAEIEKTIADIKIL